MFRFTSQLKSKFMIPSIAAALAFSTAAVSAQAPPPAIRFKNVRQEVAFSADVKVGTTVLESGRYQVTSKDQVLTFRKLRQDSASTSQWIVDMRATPVVVNTTATMLDEKSRGTQLDMPADAAGVAVLKSIVFEGSNIRFTIG